MTATLALRKPTLRTRTSGRYNVDRLSTDSRADGYHGHIDCYSCGRTDLLDAGRYAVTPASTDRPLIDDRCGPSGDQAKHCLGCAVAWELLGAEVVLVPTLAQMWAAEAWDAAGIGAN